MGDCHHVWSKEHGNAYVMEKPWRDMYTYTHMHRALGFLIFCKRAIKDRVFFNFTDGFLFDEC
jgi:hypothetical protein